MVTKINMYDKILPKDSKVEIQVDSGVSAGTEYSSVQEPDSGYKFCISYFKLTVPEEVEANVIVQTEKGETTLLSENVTNDTVIIDASDFAGLDYLSSFTLYVKVTTDTTDTRTVTLEYGGKQVIPYI